MVQKASQKWIKRQFQTVISDFGRAPVRVLSPSLWSWLPSTAWGAGWWPKSLQMGWSIRLEWHTGVTCEVVLAHPSASSTQRPWNHPLQASFFGHHRMPCDHPCALVSGVGRCLHLCALCRTRHIVWYMEYGIWITIWKMGYGSVTWNIQYGARRKECGA